MNLELNVVKFENEDVIATSGVVCSVNLSEHTYIGKNEEGLKTLVTYAYGTKEQMYEELGLNEAGWVLISGGVIQNDKYDSYDPGTWLFEDEDGKLQICEEEHNPNGYIISMSGK